MPRSATQQEIALLRDVANQHGFIEKADDCKAADRCVAEGWLIPEDHAGYALTLDGLDEVRAQEGDPPYPVAEGHAG